MIETQTTEPHKRARETKRAAEKKSVDYQVLNEICDRAYFMALRMIDIANHERDGVPKGEPKVGGHPSACGSSKHILTAIHMVCRNPEDYIACKPHVSPMDHALNFLLHNFRDANDQLLSDADRRKAMHHLRHYSGNNDPVFQSYHAETDPDGYRFFPSGSVGIPPVNALYTALGYEFIKDHGFDIPEKPTFWCLMGDSEFREGSLMEAMPDAGERQLGRVIWIVDYNRQNLDGIRVSNEAALGGSDADRIAGVAEANGWEPIILEHGKKREKLFATPDGEEFRRVLEDELSDFEFQALLAANNAELIRERIGSKSGKVKSWLKNVDDKTLHEAFFNLGGHDMETLVEAFEYAKQDTERPTIIVPYTVKGLGLRCQAMSGNHSALPEDDELKEMASSLDLDVKDPFQDFSESSKAGKYLKERRKFIVKGIDKVLAEKNARQQEWKTLAQSLDWPKDFNITALKLSPVAHTQWMWGQIAAKLDRLARENPDDSKLSDDDKVWAKFARFFLTMAPDVGSSTNTSPNMNGKLYGDIGQEDFEKTFETKDKKAPDVIPSTGERTGHLRFEIAEGNCMSAAGSFGKFGYFTGLPFYPAMTIYDFFIKRCHDQFYYNLYWKSEFATMGTPSGVTLAPEGAQHSWKSDFQIPNGVTWEPAYAKELDWILADTLRRHFTGDNDGRQAALIRCVTKGLVQKEWLVRLRTQKRFMQNAPDSLTRESQGEALGDDEILETIRQETLEGGYPLVDYRGYDGYVPGDNVVHLFAMGALVPEALKASDDLAEKGIFANVFVVTSPDLLLGNFAYHRDYDHLTETLGVNGNLHLNPDGKVEGRADWFAAQGSRIPIVSVHDGEPGLLDNIGAIVGVKHHALAIRKTSKSGTTETVFRLHGIDGEGIAEAAEKVLRETAAERIEINPDVLKSL